MPIGLVAMNDVGLDHAVDGWRSNRHGGLSGSFVAGIDRLDDLLDASPQQGAAASVVHAVLLSLTGALTGLSGVGQRRLQRTR